ncbi:MAG: hypothetical protein PS018_26450 [bacterium]|nr:hypothetical protein [bacterium]
MEVTPEVLATAAIGTLVIIGAIGKYLQSLRAPPPIVEKSSAVLAGIGLGYVEREQMERVIHELKRIADGIADKNSAGIQHKLEDMADMIDKMQSPPRRR